MKLRLTVQPEVPIEADCLSPDRIAGLDAGAVAGLELHYGNQLARVGDFFAVEGRDGELLELEGDLRRVKHIGSGMSGGTLHIEGDVGQHLGVGMSGGLIEVDGNAGDWVGPEMSGGRIIVRGDAGHMIGSAYRGSPVGILGGEIIVYGNVGNELGSTMRGGLIAVGGSSGDFAGVGMLAGTIVVLGELGLRSGAGMKRGTIVSMHDAELLPTFYYDCQYRPVFLTLYLRHLRRLGLDIDDRCLAGPYRRWSGDAVELNRGECLLLAG